MLGLVDCTSWLVFIAYVTLFVNNNLLIAFTKDKDNSYSYSTVLVVLLIELSKLTVATIFYCHKYSFHNLVADLQSNKTAFAYYLIPSVLYSIFNNLVFLNLANYNPTNYAILLQFSIVITGVIYQCLFKKDLSWQQWISLSILTLGCVISHMEEANEVFLELRDVFILIQVLCSSFAGVYNEYLLKNYSSQLDFWLQGIFMYANTSMCCVVLVTISGKLSPGVLTASSLKSVFEPVVILIVVNNVIAGLVTGLFLYKLNSILKKFALAIEMVALAILSRALLGTTVNFTKAVSILLVSVSVIVYSLNPLAIKSEVVVKPGLKLSNGDAR
ncbi:UDP-galactose transporter senju-like [Patiria miniata]|uniref:Uncharacterized protein n=1 Tax=Patiria miniata TaxID=46514 RepID=A0A914B8T5_PATMI|nr:UDP-galactose transporter senju-like [Patiria miniata]XP_038072244.1 UDP-galactose transporter senju-like [Patiria miniata]XP_038072245.1 UDP-galactose transporter senju-like [Patiria miniata]